MFGWLLIPIFEKIDSFLVQHGNFEDLQNFRLSVVLYYVKNHNLDRDLPNDLCRQLMNRETRLSQLAQREEILSERHQSLKMTSNSEEDKAQLSKLYQNLEQTRKEYWFTEREVFTKEALLPVSPLRKAYHLWRSDPTWYLHPHLVADCVGNGGCCGRDCGCCEARLHIADKRRGAGHFTAECGCCAKSRGFDLHVPADGKRAHEIYNAPIKRSLNDDYYKRIMRAYIFGTRSGA